MNVIFIAFFSFLSFSKKLLLLFTQHLHTWILNNNHQDVSLVCKLRIYFQTHTCYTSCLLPPFSSIFLKKKFSHFVFKGRKILWKTKHLLHWFFSNFVSLDLVKKNIQCFLVLLWKKKQTNKYGTNRYSGVCVSEQIRNFFAKFKNFFTLKSERKN